jgi:Ca-activated chloride channel family protein
MFRFADPEMFYLLLLVPVMIGLYVVAMRARARRLRRFGNPETVAALMPDASPRRVRNKFILTLAGVVLIVVALARPQSGSKLRERETTGVEMMLVVDVSNSMLAQDFTPTRLERTKAAINRLLNDTGQDRVGLVVFAGDAYVQLPVTADYATARTFAARLSPDMVTKQGTAIGAAIELAANSYSSQSDGGRVMIVISDGENHEDDPLAAAKAAADRGITIYAIGIGTPEGSPVMIGDDYITDEQGAMVISKLDEAMLQQMALTTGGSYVRATNQTFGLGEIVDKIRETEGERHTETVFDQYDEYFQWLLGLALAVLVFEAVMLSRRNRLLARFNIFN